MIRSLTDKMFKHARPFFPFALAVALFLTFCGGTAMGSIRFTEVGRWGGVCAAVSATGDRAFIGMGSSLVVMDLSDPTAPIRTGTLVLPTPGIVTSVAVSGRYACVLAFESGLYIVNISGRGNPAVVGFCAVNAYAREVAVSGDNAYVADWSGGLKVVDISDPAHPTPVGSYDISGTCNAVAVSGNYAYLADGSGLLAIDVSNPANPTRAGALAGVYAADIAISGNYLYTASGFNNGFQVVDISTPTSPVRAGIYDTPGEALGVAVNGSYAYVGDSSFGLRVLNVSNPASPSLVSTYDTLGSAGRVAMSGNLALVADRTDGLLAIDVSNPAAPSQAWACASGNVGGLAASGTTVYAACSEDDRSIAYALHALDTSDPESVVHTGSCAIPSSGRIELLGNYAWVAGYSRGLLVADITVPASPVLMATFDTSGTAKDAAFFDHYACVADGDSGIQIIDVTNPAAPAQVGVYNTVGFAYAVAVSGDCAFVADGSKGLQIISLANPAVPTLIGSYQTASNAYDIEISGHFAYLAAGRLQVFDIANPAVPVNIGEGSYSSYTDLALSGDRLYVSGGAYSTALGAVFDVSDPANPSLIGRGSFGAFIAASGDRVYSACSGILKIMQVSQSDQCIVYGFVKDPSGKALSGITVSADPGGYTATTDFSGRYELDYVDPGTYTISASGLGWASASTTISPSGGQTMQAADIVVLFGSLAGCARDDLGNPVSNATISTHGVVLVTTDTDGNYSIGNLSPGYYYLTASKTGHVSVSLNPIVSGAQTTTCDFTLVRTGTVTGYVRDNLGRTISDVRIGASPSIGFSAGTDSGGAYVLANVPPGTYSFTASRDSWTSVTVSNVVVAADGTVPLDFTLQLGTIAGLVRDKSNNPVAGATVTSANGGLSTMTDSSGSFTFANVVPTYGSPGPTFYQLTAAKAGYVSVANTVHVKGGQTTSSLFTLTAYGSVSGTVTDKAGRPISGALLTTTYACNTYTATSDSMGHYIISDMLPSADISLIASKIGYATVTKKLSLNDYQRMVWNLRLADAIALELVSSTSISNTLTRIAVSNGIAAVQSGTGLQFVDVSDPLSPVKLSTFGTASDVEIAGSFAYVANGSAGLQILNISNPSAPSLAGSYDTTGTARAVHVVGNYAYVADGLSGLQIINISNPAAPVRVGGYNTSGDAWGLDVANGYASVADASGGLQIIDVRNPATPSLAGNYSVSNCGFNDVAVSGGYAYVADSYQHMLYVVNMSAPSAPILVGTGHIATSTGPQKVTISGSYAYVGAGYGGLMVYDITTPASTGLVALYPAYDANDIAVSNGYIYVADYSGKLIILAPSYLKVTGIAPQRAVNSESALPVSLTGLGFEAGDTIKLTRAGQADINATEVSVADAGQITCRLNLSGAAPGFWNVIVTRTGGLSSCLSGGFTVVLADSAPCVAVVNRNVDDAIMATACARWRVRLIGKVTQTTSDSFWISDGSDAAVKVYAPDYSHTKIFTGDYVAATGSLDLSSGVPILLSSGAQIDELY